MMEMFRVGVAAAKHLFQKIGADPFGSADVVERAGQPRFRFDHFGKQSQTNRNHFPVLGQARGNRINKLLFLVVDLACVCRQFAKRLTEFRQYFSGVSDVEQVDRGEVVTFKNTIFRPFFRRNQLKLSTNPTS